MRENTSMLYLGIDIGGTSIKCAFVNEEGAISHPFTMKFIKGASAYVSGSNLLTIAKEREILEMNVGSAPQTRFYNLGVQVKF